MALEFFFGLPQPVLYSSVTIIGCLESRLTYETFVGKRVRLKADLTISSSFASTTNSMTVTIPRGAVGTVLKYIARPLPRAYIRFQGIDNLEIYCWISRQRFDVLDTTIR